MADVSRLVISVSANTGRATANLVALNRQLRSVGNAGHSATSGMNAADGGMRRLAGSTRTATNTVTRHNGAMTRSTSVTYAYGRAANSAGGSSSRFSKILHGVVISSAAMTPVMHGVVAVLGGLVAAFATAGLAAGAFGLAVVASIKDPKIQASLAGVKAKFQQWGLDIAKYTRGPVTTALDAVGNSFTKLTPLVAAMSPVVQTLANAFARWVNTRLDSWVNFLIKVGVPMFQNFITIGRNVGTTIGYLIRDFSGLGLSITESLTRSSAAMAKWAANGGFTRFIASVRENAPLIKEFFRALGDAIGNLSAAMIILGPHALRVVTILLQLVAAIPPGILAALIAGFYAFRLAMMVSTAAMIIWRAGALAAVGVQLLLTAGTLRHVAAMTLAMARIVAYRALIIAITIAQRAWAAAQWLLSAAMAASPIGLIIIAIAALIAVIVLIATKTTWFQTAWTYTWNAVRVAFFAVWNAIKISGLAIWNALRVAFQAVCSSFVVAWNAAGAGLRAAWNAVWNAMKATGLVIWTAMLIAWRATTNGFAAAWSVIGGGLRAAWNAVWNAMRTSASVVWAAIGQVVQNSMQWISNTVRVILSAIGQAWSAGWNWCRNTAAVIWAAIGQVVQNAMQWISNAVRVIIAGIGQIWQNAWNWCRNVASTIWAAIGQVVQNAMQWISNTVRVIIAAIGQIWQNAWQWIRETVRTIIAAIGQIVQNAMQWISNTIRVIIAAIGQIWQNAWQWIRETARTIIAAIGQIIQNAMNWIRETIRTIIAAIGQIWQNAWQWIRETARTIIAAIGQIIQNAMQWIRETIRTIIAATGQIWQNAWQWIRETVRTIIAATGQIIQNAMQWIRETIRSIMAAIGQIWQNAWRWIRETARTIIAAIGQIIQNAMFWIRSTVDTVLSAIGRIWGAGWDWIGNRAAGVFTWIKDKARDLASGMTSIISKLVSGLGSIWGKIQDVFAKPIRFVINTVFNKGLVPLWNNTAAKLPGIGKMSPATGFATGGYTGDGGKYQPKGVVHGGEYVTRKSSTKKMEKNHPGLLQHINNTGRLPGYALGGLVTDGDDGGLFGSGIGPDVGPDVVPGDLGDIAGKLGGALKNLGESAWNWSTGMLMMGAGQAFKTAWDIVVGPMVKVIPDGGLGGGGDNIVTKGVKKVPDTWRDAIVALIESKEITGGLGFVPFRAWKSGDEARSQYKGHTFNRRTIEMIKKAEGIYGSGFNIAQGSYNSGVGASAGTHDGGGAVDCGPANQSVVGSLRASGFAAWLRGAPFAPHVHGIAVGDPTVSPAAAQQVRDFNAGKNGLAGGGPDNYIPPARFMKYVNSGGGGGAGVERWRSLAMKAMQMGGISTSQIGKFLSLMAKESGGNPNAINRTDSNAAQGYDMMSKGLMQVIGPTFRANHVAGTSNNIFDPLANMAAAARYIKNRYGGNVPGSPYANGGVFGKGLIKVGERGPELLQMGTTGRVYNNRDSENMLGGSGGVVVAEGAVQVTIQGNVTPEVEKRMNAGFENALRRALDAGVGKH